MLHRITGNSSDIWVMVKYYLVRENYFKSYADLQIHLNECYAAFDWKVISIMREGNYYTIVSVKNEN